MAYRRLLRAKPRKRRRNGSFVKTARRPSSKTKVVVKKRRGVRKLSTMSARAYFDASRWHHKPDLRVPDQVSEYTPVRGVSRVSINGPTEAGGSAIYVFAWTPSGARCMWLTHQQSSVENYWLVGFPFVASHSNAAGPALCRPLRQSVAVRNISAAEKVAGVIRVLCTNHPLNWTLYYTGNQNSAGAHVLIDKEEHANIVSLIGAHPKTRTITNAELRSGVTIPMIPATLAEYKEYHDWQDLVPITTDIMTDASGNVMTTQPFSREHWAAMLMEEWTKKTPMETLFIEIPTAQSGFMSYDIAYHYQDAIRAKDPEGLTAQFARAARPANSTAFAAMAHAATTAQARI